MYPATFFSLFPPFPRDERVFVAMSFDPRFDARWRDVIEPAVRCVAVSDKPLDPIRVDLRRVSDSILTEILEGITRCRLVLVDISPIGELEGKAVRNANVMYELGLAHAVRQPEEVLIFRSDNRDLLFDIANVRVNRYDPDGDPAGARDRVTQTVMDALREVELKKGLAIRTAAASLALPSWIALVEAQHHPFRDPSTRTTGEALGSISRAQAIERLLELGAIRANLIHIDPDALKDPKRTIERLVSYSVTPFGTALLRYAANEMGFLSLDIQQFLKERFGGAPSAASPETM